MIDPTTSRGYHGTMKASLSIGRVLLARKTIRAFLAFLFAILMFPPANTLIQWMYPDRPIVPDIVFSLTPEIPWLAYTTDPILAAAFALFLVQALKIDRERFPYYIFSIAVLYFSRAFLMVLTPLGRPTGNLDSYGILSFTGILQHGMFPSGHQMLISLCWFLIDGTEVPRLKRAAGVLTALEAIALLLSRGHYSIDIVGGVLVSWFIVERLSRFKERFRIDTTS
jgi:membrane-associated phospholipid phosphatase